LYNTGLELNYADTGRARITFKPTDSGKFRVPSLRNVEVTGPYMHDGRFRTLQDVLDFYATGGADHPNKSELTPHLELSAEEQTQLLAFLLALTDEGFLDSKDLYRPKE